MTETKKDKVADDDPRLRGHALQDHDRVKNELEGNPRRSDPSLAPASRNEALEEVRKVRAENEERTRRHSSVEVIAEVAASSPSGERGRQAGFAGDGGRPAAHRFARREGARP
jgi:hypothetical protein